MSASPELPDQPDELGDLEVDPADAVKVTGGTEPSDNDPLIPCV